MPARPAKFATPHPAPVRALGKPGTPEEVREAFTAQRQQIGPVFIEPLSVAHLWILEEVNHPFHAGQRLMQDAAGKRVPALDAGKKPLLDPGTGNPLYVVEPLSVRDTARLIFAFHDIAAAGAALTAGGEAAYDARAMALARGIEPALLPKIAAIIHAAVAGLAGMQADAN